MPLPFFLLLQMKVQPDMERMRWKDVKKKMEVLMRQCEAPGASLNLYMAFGDLFPSVLH